jgi:hypothetical protein
MENDYKFRYFIVFHWFGRRNSDGLQMEGISRSFSKTKHPYWVTDPDILGELENGYAKMLSESNDLFDVQLNITSITEVPFEDDYNPDDY